MSIAFDALTTADLYGLASALRSGRLSPPFSYLAFSPYLGREGQPIAPTFAKLCDEGLSAQHLALFLDAIASERTTRQGVDETVDLVTTGPDSLGYPTRDTRIVVRELFREARESVMVAGFAVYQGRDVFQALADRMAAQPDLRVRMFLDVQRTHGDTSRASELLRRFADRFKSEEWPGSRLPEVYYDPRALDDNARKRSSLHAKCVVADESKAFISSANFTEAAQTRNIEVGVLIRSPAVARQLTSHFYALVDRQMLLRIPGL